MVFKCHLFKTFRNFPLQLFFTVSNFLVKNLFLTVNTIFKWDFQSKATFKVQLFVAEYLRKKCGDLNEVAPDNGDDKDDDDDANTKDTEVVEMGTNEALTSCAFLH